MTITSHDDVEVARKSTELERNGDACATGVASLVRPPTNCVSLSIADMEVPLLPHHATGLDTRLRFQENIWSLSWLRRPSCLHSSHWRRWSSCVCGACFRQACSCCAYSFCILESALVRSHLSLDVLMRSKERAVLFFVPIWLASHLGGGETGSKKACAEKRSNWSLDSQPAGWDLHKSRQLSESGSCAGSDGLLSLSRIDPGVQLMLL